MRVYVTDVFNFTCLLHNYFEGKEAVVKKQSIKCGCEYFVQLRKPSREPNAPWRITQWGYMHHIRIPAGAFDQPAAGSPRLLF